MPCFTRIFAARIPAVLVGALVCGLTACEGRPSTLEPEQPVPARIHWLTSADSLKNLVVGYYFSGVAIVYDAQGRWVLPLDDQMRWTYVLTFTSSDPACVRALPTGTIQALAPGTAIVTAQAGAAKVQKVVRVHPADTAQRAPGMALTGSGGTT